MFQTQLMIAIHLFTAVRTTRVEISAEIGRTKTNQPETFARFG